MSDWSLAVFDGALDLSMVICPCAGYIIQTRKMYIEKQFQGFSTYVSFILILSNVIRIFWWYVEQFSTVILNASLLMIFCQMSLLYVWVQVKQASTKPNLKPKTIQHEI